MSYERSDSGMHVESFRSKQKGRLKTIYRSLVERSFSEREIEALFNDMLQMPTSQTRLFKIESDGVLLTNSALRRIIFGTQV
ncbi:MAG: hypothetical protein MHPSP_000305 [Paramarteilia canceri]